MRNINKHEDPGSTYTTKIESLRRMMLQKPDSVELLDMVIERLREREREKINK